MVHSPHMKLCCTVSTGPVAFGPILFREGNLKNALSAAARIGFDGTDLFIHEQLSAAQVRELRRMLDGEGLVSGMVAGIWMGASGVDLAQSVERRRRDSIDAVRAHLDTVALLGGGAPIGFIRGRRGDRSVPQYEATLAESVRVLMTHCCASSTPFYLEPINRYEIDSFPTVVSTLSFLREFDLDHVSVLVDLFHMNIEDPSIPQALKQATGRIGHVHAADSNRRVPGRGHIDFAGVFRCLRRARYTSAVSIEALVDSDAEAEAEEGLTVLRDALSRSALE